MKGTVISFSEEGKYGFIESDEDGFHYFFHKNNMLDKKEINKNDRVSFTEGFNKKGFFAKEIKTLKEDLKYSFEKFKYTKDYSFKDCEILEKSDWKLHFSSDNSPEDAKQGLISFAKDLAINGLTELNYYKTTGSKPGTGNGTYYYTVHNFSARPVIIAKRDIKGTLTKETAFTYLNERISDIKQKLKKDSDISTKKSLLIWFLIISINFSYFFIPECNQFIQSILGLKNQIGYIWYIGISIILIMFSKKHNYDNFIRFSPSD